eukprot:TRINITY_DN31051_c0_g1_i1.p1 TRINITY_DN31051_c0_g1~~TRINITY_DN31051_c0_g1_i1.p1  ORF type:complete len:584 (+),score=101.13 TRINITY_DN31051_c0_g1_i1:84-1754(+)
MTGAAAAAGEARPPRSSRGAPWRAGCAALLLLVSRAAAAGPGPSDPVAVPEFCPQRGRLPPVRLCVHVSWMGGPKLRQNHIALMRAMAVSSKVYFMFHHSLDWDRLDPVTAAVMELRPANVRFVRPLRPYGNLTGLMSVNQRTLRMAAARGLDVHPRHNKTSPRWHTRPLYLAGGLLPDGVVPQECTHMGWLEHDVLPGNLSLFLPCDDLRSFDVLGVGSSFNLMPWTDSITGSFVNPTWAQMAFWRSGSAFDTDGAEQLSVVRSCFLRNSSVPVCQRRDPCTVSCQNLHVEDGCISSEAVRRLRVKVYGHSFGHAWNRDAYLEAVKAGGSLVDALVDAHGVFYCAPHDRLKRMVSFLSQPQPVSKPGVRIAHGQSFDWPNGTGRCAGPFHVPSCNRWCFSRPAGSRHTPAELDRAMGVYADIELSRGQGFLRPPVARSALRYMREIPLAGGRGTMRCMPMLGWHLFTDFANASSAPNSTAVRARWGNETARLMEADRLLLGRVGPSPGPNPLRHRRISALRPGKPWKVWADFGRPLPPLKPLRPTKAAAGPRHPP